MSAGCSGPSCRCLYRSADEREYHPNSWPSASLRRRKTIARKIRELWYALQIERAAPSRKSSNSIATRSTLWPQAYGIEAASQIYFQKSAQDINLGVRHPGCPPLRPNAYSDCLEWLNHGCSAQDGQMGHITSRKPTRRGKGFGRIQPETWRSHSHLERQD